MTVIYRLNFFLKLAAAFAVMLGAWLAPGRISAVSITVVVLGAIVTLPVPGWRAYLKGVAILIILAMASWMLNLSLQGVAPSAAADIAFRMACRLVSTTGAFYFVMETSTPGSIMAASSAARLPPMATLVLSLTFGIVPMLRQEFEHIADAQRARGLEIDRAPFHTRLRYALARGVPLLVQAVRMAHAISVSLTVSGLNPAVKRVTWRHVGLLVEDRLVLADGPGRDGGRSAILRPDERL